MEADPKELLEYEMEDGQSPFSVWLDGLRDVQARAGQWGMECLN